MNVSEAEITAHVNKILTSMVDRKGNIDLNTAVAVLVGHVVALEYKVKFLENQKQSDNG